MSIPFKARVVDLANLVVVKGANFLLTVLLFAIISRGMSSPAFAEFGYWWSIAIMIGGVLLGGISSAIVRTAAMHGSLRHLARPLRHTAVAAAVLSLVAILASQTMPGHADTIRLLVAAASFGVAVQAQTAVFALLRAVEATRANVLASALVVALVPLLLAMLLGTMPSLGRVLWDLTIAFAMGTLVALATAWKDLGHLFSPTAQGPGGAGAEFTASASSFSAVSVFAYALFNIDFTLFRWIGEPEDFAMMATGKIFFERFVLPAVLVFAGAISIRVLRHPIGPGTAMAKLEARLLPWHALAGVGAILLQCLAYWVFVRLIRGDTSVIAWQWIACAAAGYLLFAVNGILFDVFVLRRSLSAVVTYAAGFLVFGSVLQFLAISGFGIPGWALGWLIFHATLAVALSREGLRLDLTGWRRRDPNV